MTLKDRIGADMKAAMRARDAARLSTVRLILAAIKQREVDERIELDDGAVLGVLQKMAKQRRDSIDQYRSAGRSDLETAEQAELDLIVGYMPPPLDDDALERLIAQAINDLGAAGPADMGRVMALLKDRLGGRADMGQVSGKVRSALTG